jgi:hypothetical protein
MRFFERPSADSLAGASPSQSYCTPNGYRGRARLPMNVVLVTLARQEPRPPKAIGRQVVGMVGRGSCRAFPSFIGTTNRFEVWRLLPSRSVTKARFLKHALRLVKARKSVNEGHEASQGIVIFHGLQIACNYLTCKNSGTKHVSKCQRPGGNGRPHNLPDPMTRFLRPVFHGWSLPV